MMISGCGFFGLVLLMFSGGPEPLHVEPGRGVCKSMLGTFECAMEIERRHLPEAPLVSRQEAGLCFELLDSRKCIPDVPGPEDPTTYYFLGTLPEPSYHVLWAQSTEYSNVLLVHGATGETVLVDDVPVASPHGRFVAVASRDLFAGARTNRLSIWRVHGSQIRMVWSVNPGDWGPGRPTWHGDAAVVVPRIESTPRLQEAQTGSMTIRLVNGSWRIKRE